MASRGDRRGLSSRALIDGASERFSEQASDDGRMAPNGAVPSSSKASMLANEIANMEQKCDWLEGRNKWLTDKLLRGQRKFIERIVLDNFRSSMTSAFQGWCGAMNLLRLENQLEKQTASLDKCQQVAKELGAALAREQEVNRKHQEARRNIEADFEELAAAHTQLKDVSQTQGRDLQSLQRQLQLGSSGLENAKNEAQLIVDHIDKLQTRAREMKKEDPAGDDLAKTNSPSRVFSGAIEESMKSRDGAQLVMNSMSGLLKQTSANTSPDRDRSRQTGGYQSTMLVGEPGSYASGARGQRSRSQSPMESNFQAVNQAVSKFEEDQGASGAGSDLIWATSSRSSPTNSQRPFGRQTQLDSERRSTSTLGR